MHIPALALTLLASSAAAVPPAAPPAPATPPTQTTTSDSTADAKAKAEAVISWFFSELTDPASADAPLSTSPRGTITPRTPHPAPSSWPDQREQPRRQPGGFSIGAFARAEAHASSRSKSSSSLNSRLNDARTGDSRDRAGNTSSSSSRSRASAEARIMLIGPFAPSADGTFADHRPEAPRRSPAERDREQALTKLAATKDWAAAVTTLGQTYLDNPELLSAPIEETVSTLGMSLRELTDRAINLARRENKLPQWIAAAALQHADGRIESAKALLAKVKPTNQDDAAKLDEFRTTLRIRSAPTSAAPQTAP